MILTITGKVEIYETPFDTAVDADRAGLRLLWAGDNVVTNRGRQVIMAALAGAAGSPTIDIAYDPSTKANLIVTVMKVGNSVAPPAASATDTALTDGTPYTTPSFNVSYPGVGQVRFSGVIPTLDLAGQTLTEEGIFTTGGVLVARHTFTRLKTGSLGLQIDHTLTLT